MRRDWNEAAKEWQEAAGARRGEDSSLEPSRGYGPTHTFI